METMSKIVEDNTGEFIQKGCKCKRSACLKKYCRCYVNQVRCAWFCGCVGCRNHDEDMLEEQSETETLIQNAELLVAVQLEDSADIEGAYYAETDFGNGAGVDNGDDPINMTENVREPAIEEASIDETLSSTETTTSIQQSESDEEVDTVIQEIHCSLLHLLESGKESLERSNLS